MRIAPPIDLTPEQQEAVEQYDRARSLSVRLVERARIVLLAAAGKQDKALPPPGFRLAYPALY